MERNRIACARDLDFLASLPDESIDVWWASPPYNLADEFRGGSGRQGGAGEFRYAGATRRRGDGCDLPEPAYQRWQAAVLREWHRTLKPDGVAFYNHKVRPKDGQAISPLEWIPRPPLVLVQEVVWDRGGTPQVDDRRFLPVSERVYVLGKRAGLKLANPTRIKDVLYLPPTHHTRAASGHPCPTPPTLVRLCLSVVPRPADGRRLLVADCYAGLGTTGVIARQLGMDYLLCDVAAEYVDLAGQRVNGPAALPLPLLEAQRDGRTRDDD